ncbi:TP53-target gene 5 protein [Hemicordylus capensis]|uniref:TP53-target gene 5 protein n=1 Tax=Hemicordylus capensis TaxID=884348 RepID=UPI002304CD9E|nr:TP53-target gene 5 protein [Hemicordylus capensis]
MKNLEKKKECPKINIVESGGTHSSNLAHIRSHLRRILKKLILLKMLKSQKNRRIQWLCDLAHKYQKMLALGGPLDIPISPSGMNVTSEKPPNPDADMVSEPVMDVDEVTLDKEIDASATSEPPLESTSSELYKALCLKGLPQRLHMPAPKMLCRPSTLRWTKPCCTRSCYETLEHIFTIHYSECPDARPKQD